MEHSASAVRGLVSRQISVIGNQLRNPTYFVVEAKRVMQDHNPGLRTSGRSALGNKVRTSSGYG